MLFFRAGKMTLEFIENTTDIPEQDFFRGIAFLCPDLGAVHTAMQAKMQERQGG